MWQALVKTALIGTEKTPIPKALRDELEKLGLDTSDISNEQLILEAAAIYARLQKAASSPPVYDGAFFSPIKQKEEAVSTLATQFLDRIINGNYGMLLDEYLRLVSVNEKVLPAVHLPQLLNAAVTNEKLWVKVKSVIGKRGYWLIGLNPDWKTLAAITDSENWATGRKFERLALLKYLRKEQPDVARQLLTDTWDEESVADQVHFLKIFEVGLEKADESLLEQALDSSRKEVRQVAASLLVKLPNSAWQDRMTKRLEQLINIKTRKTKGEKLDIQLPESITDDMKRDGIDARKTQKKGGVRAARFLQIMSYVPPTFWTEQLATTPEKIIKIFARSEWYQLLLDGIIGANIHNPDQEWIKTILSFWIEHYDHARWEKLNAKSLFPLLTEKTYNELLIKELETPGMSDEKAPLVRLLQIPDYQWSDKLTSKAIKALKCWIENDRSHYWKQTHLHVLFKNIGYCCRPELFDYFNKKWPRHERVWASWQDDIDEFLRVLRFRVEMERSIMES